MIVVFDRGSDRGGSPCLSVDTIFPWFEVLGFTTMGGAVGALASGVFWGSPAGIPLLGWLGSMVGWVAFSSR
jgi:hypothetical protein